MGKKKKIKVKFTRDELNLIYTVFSELTDKSLSEWMELIETGKYKTEKCDRRWRTTSIYYLIMCRVSDALGNKATKLTGSKRNRCK